MFEFTDDCKIGIEHIDEEHKYLFDILNRAYILVTTDYHSDYYQRLKEIIAELDHYAEQHFTHEEEYQKSIHYPYIAQHAAQHRQFEDRLAAIDLSSISDDYEEQDETVQEILDFLVDWLINHIMRVDMKYVNK